MSATLSEMVDGLKDVAKASANVRESFRGLAEVARRIVAASIPPMTNPIGGIAFYRPRYGEPEPKEPFKKRLFSRKARKWAAANPERMSNGHYRAALEEILGERLKRDWHARLELAKRLDELHRMDAVTKLAQLT